MSQVINASAFKLLSQISLNELQPALGTSVERLSSELRINSDKDDAANWAISNRFTANITGLTQADKHNHSGNTGKNR